LQTLFLTMPGLSLCGCAEGSQTPIQAIPETGRAGKGGYPAKEQARVVLELLRADLP
jgi:hypothetical protein